MQIRSGKGRLVSRRDAMTTDIPSAWMTSARDIASANKGSVPASEIPWPLDENTSLEGTPALVGSQCSPEP